MIIKLWYQQIKNGRRSYSSVPAKLKDAVAQMLRDNGYENLIEE